MQQRSNDSHPMCTPMCSPPKMLWQSSFQKSFYLFLGFFFCGGFCFNSINFGVSCSTHIQRVEMSLKGICSLFSHRHGTRHFHTLFQYMDPYSYSVFISNIKYRWDGLWIEIRWCFIVLLIIVSPFYIAMNCSRSDHARGIW